MKVTVQSTVQVDFSLAVGNGRLDASLSVPGDEITLTQLLPVLQTLSSNIIGSAIKNVEGAGYSISCRAGCGACCRQLVPLSLFEAEALADWIHSLPPDEQAALEARFRAALMALSQSGMLARMNPTNQEGDEQQLAVDYMAQKIPCPFLIDESCGIYPIRPLICREYLVTSPAEFCDAPADYPVAGLPVPLKLSKVLFRAGAQLAQEGRGWIPLVFLFAWMRGGFQPGDSIRAPGPELLYKIIKSLTSNESGRIARAAPLPYTEGSS